jgi:hypothetical protein
MAEVTIPFDGKPHRFYVPDKNLVEVLSPGSYACIENLELNREGPRPPIRQDPGRCIW